MTPLFIASVIVVNPYFQAQVIPSGEVGNLLQEDSVSLILQQDGTSTVMREFTPGGNLLQQDGFYLFQEDGTSKIKQEE